MKDRRKEAKKVECERRCRNISKIVMQRVEAMVVDLVKRNFIEGR